MTDDELELLAQTAELRFVRRIRTMNDFRYDELQQKYWDMTTGHLLGPKSVDGAIPRSLWPTRELQDGRLAPYPPSTAINDVDTGLTVDSSTWWPGQPQLIENMIVNIHGAMQHKGAVCYNSYMAPIYRTNVPIRRPDRWIEHVKYVFPEPVEHEHFFDFCAHMIQRPHEKVNHGVVMAGVQGIGKDTAILPLRYGVGEWNTKEITPDDITSQYNGYLQSVLLIINEVRPHDEQFKASNFYNMLKPLLAAPPDALPMNLKYANVIYVRNLCHVLLTTNDPLTMYIPAEDRRLFVMTSPLPDPKLHPVFRPDYFENIYRYFNDGGAEAVVKWLRERDIFGFKSSDPPPITAGKHLIINSAQQIRRTEFDDVFEKFMEKINGGKPPEILFHRDLSMFVAESNYFDDKDKILKVLTAKNFHFKMDERGYDMLRHPYNNEWQNGKYRSRIAFIRKAVPHSERVSIAEHALRHRPLMFGE